MHLSFEIVRSESKVNEPCVVECFLDKEGIDHLMRVLQELQKNMRESEHAHLMADSWGGQDLSDSTIGSNNISVKHVKIISCDKNL